MLINQLFRLIFIGMQAIWLLMPAAVAETIDMPTRPALLLANVYQPGLHVPDYLISEKYDGVRAYWDGKAFYTRAGRRIIAPQWFIEHFPTVALDGELWLARGQFDALSGTVRKTQPIDKDWRAIHYQVFELPGARGTFAERVKQLAQIVAQARLPQLNMVEQFYLPDERALYQRLDRVIAAGGEGLMLHRADALYVTGRSDVLLKLKPLYDAEATVLGYVAGRGKYAGKMGALLLETPAHIRFKLGTGFTDAQRAHPPVIGSVVTYTYRGLTTTGKPRFASFLRLRLAD